jgi:hypothetical protein
MLLRVIRVTDVARPVAGSAVSATAFVVADWLLPGRVVDSMWPILIASAGPGILGLVHVSGPERLLREKIELRWLALLLPGLAADPGIGFVAVLDGAGPIDGVREP